MHGEPFTFGVAVMARATARDWARVRELLDLTLGSVAAQTERNHRTVVVAHEALAVGDRRATLLQAEWPAPAPGDFAGQMTDAGRKQQLIQRWTLERGGGLLMLLDADDWVETGFVAGARGALAGGAVGALVERGLLVDVHTLKTAGIPDPAIVAQPFHQVCGSSGVFRLRPDEADPFRRNPLTELRLHHRWREDAQALGVELGSIPAGAAYVVNTGQNNSETVGPHAAWRRGVVAEINRRGTRLDAAEAARFGQDLAVLAGRGDFGVDERRVSRL